MSSFDSNAPENRLAGLRITLVIHSLAGGGAERQMSLLAKYLSLANAKVTLITFDDGQHDAYRLDPAIDRVCLDQMGVSPNKWIALLANKRRSDALKQAVVKSEPQVIISFCDRTNIATLLACRSLGTPIIISERSDPRRQKLGWIWELLRRLAYRSSQRCIAQTTVIAAYLKGIVGKRCVIEVIPSAIETPSSFETNAHDGLEQLDASRLKKDDSVKRLLYVGRLSTEKGPERLLNCWKAIESRHADWQLVYVGDGGLRQHLGKQICESGLSSRVQLIGWQKEMEAIWKQADAFVLSSYYEGFPNALLEALWHQVPSVATCCSDSIPLILEHEKSGLVAANDDVSLQMNLDRLLSDHRLRDKFRGCSRESVKPYLWDTVCHQWYNAIAQTIVN